MATITFTGPTYKLADDDLTPGEGQVPDITLMKWFNLAKGHDGVSVSAPQTGVTRFKIDSSHIPPGILALSLSNGFTVDDAPTFFKMSQATYATDVPDGIRKRSYQDETEQTIVRKWSEWKDANHSHLTALDGDAIVPGNAIDGQETSSAELLVLLSAGYTILLNHEVNSLLS